MWSQVVNGEWITICVAPREFRGIEALKQALRHRLADQGIMAVDLEAPERAVNAEPAGMAREHLLDLAGCTPPIAVEQVRAEKSWISRSRCRSRSQSRWAGIDLMDNAAPSTGFDMACSLTVSDDGSSARPVK